MKYAAIALGCFLGLAYAQDEEKPPEQPKEEGASEEDEEEKKPDPPPAAPADPVKIISDLTLANAAEDVPRIDIAAKEALRWAQGAKDEALAETLAKELADSFKAAKGNWGTLTTVVQALGELRTKDGAKTLKKMAFQKKKAKDEQEEKLQAAAIVALGKMAEPRDISGFEEISKSDNKLIAKAAYEALGCYGTAKAKIRKQCAEALMKRLEMEYPSSGGQGGKSVSAEKQERWGEVSPVMVNSMKALCREATINDIDNWREWWKENKKKSWKDDDDEKDS